MRGQTDIGFFFNPLRSACTHFNISFLTTLFSLLPHIFFVNSSACSNERPNRYSYSHPRLYIVYSMCAAGCSLHRQELATKKLSLSTSFSSLVSLAAYSSSSSSILSSSCWQLVAQQTDWQTPPLTFLPRLSPSSCCRLFSTAAFQKGKGEGGGGKSLD